MRRRISRLLHYRLLRALLLLAPRPVWLLPALLLATIRAAADPESRRLAKVALPALGRPAGALARWCFAWDLAYAYEAGQLLGLQRHRLTEAWALRHVALVGAPPSGGAILLTVHHANARLAHLRLRAAGLALAQIVGEGEPERVALRGMPPGLLASRAALRHRLFEGRIFTTPHAARPALRFLREGGYVVLLADTVPPGQHAPRRAILGRAQPVPRGAAWLATRSGRPIVPFIVRPAGGHLELWIGAPVPATPDGIAAGIASCLRRASGSWEKTFWLRWAASPPRTADRDHEIDASDEKGWHDDV